MIDRDGAWRSPVKFLLLVPVRGRSRAGVDDAAVVDLVVAFGFEQRGAVRGAVAVDVDDLGVAVAALRQLDDLDSRPAFLWPALLGPALLGPDGLGAARLDEVGLVLADNGRRGRLFRSAQTQAVLDGLQEPAHDVAADGDLDLDGLVVVAVDSRAGPAALQLEVLGYVAGVVVTAIAQGLAGEVHAVGISAAVAVRGVAGVVVDGPQLVLPGRARDGLAGREADLTWEGRHPVGPAGSARTGDDDVMRDGCDRSRCRVQHSCWC